MSYETKGSIFYITLQHASFLLRLHIDYVYLSFSLISLITSPHYVLLSRDILASLVHNANENLFIFITLLFHACSLQKKTKHHKQKSPNFVSQKLTEEDNEDLRNPLPILATTLLKTCSPNC